MRQSRDAYFLTEAALIATRSKDLRTRVGAVIVGDGREVLSKGYNGLPAGVDDTRQDLLQPPAKYLWTVHAEMNAICLAGRHGTALSGGTIYVTHPPCCDCAKAIAQVKIRRAIWLTPSEDFLSRWGEQYDVTREILRWSGVEFSEHQSDPMVRMIQGVEP